MPYGVVCNVQDGKINKDYVLTDIHTNGYGFDNKYGVFYGSESFVIKPYLRPMSSMTEKEKEEYYSMYCTRSMLVKFDNEALPYKINIPHYETLGWLNAHYFDYRRLIEKGLAIEVTEENNPYK